jgi:hypothetical protein
MLFVRRPAQPQLCRILERDPWGVRTERGSLRCLPIRVLVFVSGGTEAISYHVCINLIANSEDVICSVRHRLLYWVPPAALDYASLGETSRCYSGHSDLDRQAKQGFRHHFIYIFVDYPAL